MGLSTAVSSIGAREKYGKITLTPTVQEIPVEIKDANVGLGFGFFHGAAVPYRTLQRNEDGKKIGDITLNINDIHWIKDESDQKVGQIKCTVNNTQVLFNVTLYKDKNFLYLGSRYRRWYGYPAQGLILVTIPVDITLNVALIGAAIIIVPIGLGIYELTKPNPPLQPTGTLARNIF
jgi:hypothetical protein